MGVVQKFYNNDYICVISQLTFVLKVGSALAKTSSLTTFTCSAKVAHIKAVRPCSNNNIFMTIWLEILLVLTRQLVYRSLLVQAH